MIQDDHPNRDDPIRDDYLIGDAATTSPFLTGAATSGLVAASPATTPAPAPPGSPDADGGPVTTPPDEQGMPAGSDPDGTLVPCRICGRPLSQPRIDYGRTTCRDHYHLEAEAEHAMSSAAPPTAPGRDHPRRATPQQQRFTLRPATTSPCPWTTTWTHFWPPSAGSGEGPPRPAQQRPHHAPGRPRHRGRRRREPDRGVPVAG